MDKDDIQIMDVEDYKGNEQTQFSHQALVMRAMVKALEYGCREMHDGYNEVIEDNKGNKKVIYKEDTKLAFIESVKTCMMVMACDFDEVFNNEHAEIMKGLEEAEKHYTESQNKFYDDMDYEDEKKFKKTIGEVNPNYLNKSLPYYYEYTAFLVDAYRKIYAELSKLTKRLDFYQEEEWTA